MDVFKRPLLVALILLLSTCLSFSQNEIKDSLKNKVDSVKVAKGIKVERVAEIQVDTNNLNSGAIYSTSDENIQKAIENWKYKFKNGDIYANVTDPKAGVVLPDSVYRERLNSIQTIIPLTYNKLVKERILYYTKNKGGRLQMSRMLGVAQYYFPIFEQILDVNNLPIEIKYLSVIESALRNDARSPVGAKGLWQFMWNTGKQYGLEQNSLIDERMDPIKSTLAAMEYLKDSYKAYGDWYLAIASYNCGGGRVNKAIRRTGGKRNYWDIYYRLPSETRGYVPNFIAAVYAFNFHKEHGIYAAEPAIPILTDTILINKELHFNQISDVIKISKKTLRALNPQYIRGIIPAFRKDYALILPVSYVDDFIDLQDSIVNYKREKYFNITERSADPSKRYKKYAHLAPKNKVKIIYRVKSGDNVGFISCWFKIKAWQLREWNGIRRNKIRVGQKLTIYVSKKNKKYYQGFNKMTFAQKQAAIGKKSGGKQIAKASLKTKKDPNYIYHKVKRGDNLYDIAKKHPGISSKDIQKLNGMDTNNIKPGDYIKIKKK